MSLMGDDRGLEKMVRKFDGTNWPIWESRMTDYLIIKGLDQCLDGESEDA